MSTLMHIAPAEAWHVPKDAALEAAWTYFSDNINKLIEPMKPVDDVPMFHFDPEGWPEATCPSCRQVHAGEAFLDMLGETYLRLNTDQTATRSMDITAPCCGAQVLVDQFEFPVVELSVPEDEQADWKFYRSAGLFRIGLCNWDYDTPLTAAQREDIARLLGCPIQLVFYHF